MNYYNHLQKNNINDVDDMVNDVIFDKRDPIAWSSIGSVLKNELFITWRVSKVQTIDNHKGPRSDHDYVTERWPCRL